MCVSKLYQYHGKSASMLSLPPSVENALNHAERCEQSVPIDNKALVPAATAQEGKKGW